MRIESYTAAKSFYYFKRPQNIGVHSGWLGHLFQFPGFSEAEVMIN